MNKELSHIFLEETTETPSPLTRDQAIHFFQKAHAHGFSNEALSDFLLEQTEEVNIELYDWFLEYSEETLEKEINATKPTAESTIKEDIKFICTTLLFTAVFTSFLSEVATSFNPAMRVEYPIFNHLGNADTMLGITTLLYTTFGAPFALIQNRLIKKDMLRYKKTIDLVSDFLYTIVPIIAVSLSLLLVIDVETLQLTPLPKEAMGTPNV